MKRMTVDVVCTDRGQHPSRRLARYVDRREHEFVADDGQAYRGFQIYMPEPTGTWPRPKAAGKSYQGGSVPLPRSQDLERHGWTVHCPTCNRTPRLRDSTLGKAVDALPARGGRVVVDISALPF